MKSNVHSSETSVALFYKAFLLGWIPYRPAYKNFYNEQTRIK